MSKEEIVNEQFSLVSTSTLPAKVSEFIVAAAIERQKYIPKIRQFGFVDSSPAPGDATYTWNVLDSLTAARKVAQGSEPSYEDANATESSDYIYNIMKAFKITWEADNLKKISIRAAQTRAAVDEVFDYEDCMILDQLYSDAGNSNTSPSDWSANTADPVKDIRNLKRLNRDDGYTSDVMFLHPTNNEELDSVIASNTWYSVTEQTLRTGEPLPFMGLKRIEAVGASCAGWGVGKVMVAKSGINGAFILAEAQPLKLHIFDDNDARTTKVQVYERVLPCATVRVNAVAKAYTI